MSDGVRFFSAGPLSVIGIIIIIALVILIIPLLFLGLVGAAFTRFGFSWIAAVALVLLMLLGSLVNIPLWKIKRDMVRVTPDAEPVFAGIEPAWTQPPVWETLVSLNLGGAVIPVIVSLYILYRATGTTGNSLLLYTLASILIVAAVAYVTARPLRGFGIKTPMFIPGLVALLSGLLFGGGVGLTAGVIAFVSGTAGTLLGANIAHLLRVKDLDVPQVSIGGAGTFGAVFICCILSALIA